MDLSTLVIPSVVVVLGVNLLKVLYGKVSERWGALIAQVSLLCVSFAVAGVGAMLGALPPQMYQTTLTIFVSGMAVYEVVYKAIIQKAILNK